MPFPKVMTLVKSVIRNKKAYRTSDMLILLRLKVRFIHNFGNGRVNTFILGFSDM